jgi:Mor family transcriptional regulator
MARTWKATPLYKVWDHMTQLELSKQFKVSPSHIHRIIHFKAWA